MGKSPQGPQIGAVEASSFRHLAELIGVSEKAVRKAETAGVFSNQAVRRGSDGRPSVLDLNLAMVEWIRSGRQFRGPASKPVTPSVGETMSSGHASETPTASPAAPVADAAADIVEDDAQDNLLLDQAPTLVQAQRMAMIERARKLRLENDLREGLLLDVDRVATEAFEFARVVREAVLNIPARISAELAAEPDAGRVYLRLDGALREALEATATKLSEPQISQSPTGDLHT